MQISATDSLMKMSATAWELHGATSGAEQFDALLEQSQTDEREAKMKKAVEQFVGAAFYLPLLKAVRNSPLKSDLMHGGFGEDAFGAQLDQELADRIASRSGAGLVDSIVDRYRANLSGGTSERSMDRVG